MTIFKNDIVQFFDPKCGKTIGFVENRTAKAMKLVYEKDGRLFSYKTNARIAPDALIEALKVMPAEKGATIPARIQELVNEATAPAAKKNDIVKFMHEGKECTGRVVKGGKNAEVTLDEQHVIRLPSVDLSPGTTPPADKELEDWSILSYRVVHGHDDSEPFQAVIGYKGKPVIYASNDGWGGCNSYQAKTTAAKEVLGLFESAIADFSNRIGNTYPENADLWVHWEWYLRPTGLSFEKYLSSMPSFD